MDTQRDVRLLWLIFLLLALGGIWCFLGSGYGQETLPKAEVGTGAVEEAKRLDTRASKLAMEGKYAEALSIEQQVLALMEQALGPDHPDVATTLHHLGLLYVRQGQYTEAASSYQRALRIQKRALGPDHPDVATTLDGLAGLSAAQGQYTEAASSYQRALRIQERALGPNHPDVATRLNNLGRHYLGLGQYPEAIPLFERALSIWKQALRPDDPSVAICLINLAASYQFQKQYAQAAPLYEEALRILTQTLGTHNPTFAGGLNNLARVYHHQRRYAEAESLHQQALHIREQVLGPTHPEVAASFHNLAELYYDQGQYAKAAPLYQRSYSILEQALDPNHFNVGTSLHGQALLAFAQGDHTHAVQLQTRSSDIREHNLVEMLIGGTEAQKLASVVMLRSEADEIISLHTRLAPHNPQVLRLALTTVLRRKGRVLDVMTNTVAALRRRMQPEDQQLLTQWAAVRGELATMIFKGLGAQPAEIDQAQIPRLKSQAQQLEAQLSARSAAFRMQTQPVTLEQVQAAIPEGTALVELALYTPFTLPKQWGPARYVAYVLLHQGDPTWVDLGEAAPIEQTVQLFGDNLNSSDSLQVKETARALDKLVMEPIRPLLGPVRHVLLAPDGVLNLIPFGALVDETQHYLLERFTISYLTTGRDLLRSPSQRPAPQPPLVVGNPDFNTLKPAAGKQIAAAAPSYTARRSVNGQTLHSWRLLPNTAQEIAAVQRLLPRSQLWTGIAASESALKQVQGPRLLHLATHGFFLDDQRLSGENPLLRSGLVLAGANVLQAGPEDGHLTALEVAGLDLWGTELVVLSACDSGLGKTSTGEGVYGLRRAFVIAGADSQVMSLWKVADEATRELMVAYYRRLLAGEGRAEALRQTQLAMLANPQRQHPFYWAAFILSGAWTPLTPR